MNHAADASGNTLSASSFRRLFRNEIVKHGDYVEDGNSGFGLVQRLHDAHLIVPVIMVTATSPHEELARNPELHVEALLLKPYTMDELLDAVKNVMRANGHRRAEIIPPTKPLSIAGGRRLE